MSISSLERPLKSWKDQREAKVADFDFKPKKVGNVGQNLLGFEVEDSHFGFPLILSTLKEPLKGRYGHIDTSSPIMSFAYSIVLSLTSLVNMMSGKTMCSVIWSSSVTLCISHISLPLPFSPKARTIAYYRLIVRECDSGRKVCPWKTTMSVND